jgi:hypothetical protein
MTMLSRWAARKTDEDLLATMVRMDESGHADGKIFLALYEESQARDFEMCGGCGARPANTLTADGSWVGCKACATAPTHP